MTDTNPLAEVIARLEAHVAEGIENCECVMAPDLPAILAALKAGQRVVDSELAWLRADAAGDVDSANFQLQEAERDMAELVRVYREGD